MKWHTALIENIKMLKRINSLQALREERGSILVLTAVLLPLMLGMLGFAYDVGNLYMHKSRLQNVADAAALAGARAFIDSQSKKEGPKDALDTTTSTDKSELYTLNGGSKNRGEPHADADTAADNYIYKNMVNLGNSVKSDKYSHYALESSGKAYYRIGLSEEVPLYFLPIILKNKYSQNVSVDAIALLPAEEEDEFPPTIFGSLYTYSGYLNSMQGTMSNPNDDMLGKKPGANGTSGATIKMTFDGKMIYTGNQTVTDTYRFESQYIKHFYTYEGKTEQLNQNLSIYEMGTNYTNDPKKTSAPINLSSYEDILTENLLQREHIELHMNKAADKAKYTIANISNKDSDLYKRQVKDSNGNIVTETIVTNVFYVTDDTDAPELVIDQKVIGSGNTEEPIYIINGTNQEFKIHVKKDNVRPIAIIHMRTNNVQITIDAGATFNGVIYAPHVAGGGEGGVKLQLYGRNGNEAAFEGNIVAANIGISNDGTARFKQVNHLEKDQSLYEKIVKRASELGQLFGDDTADLTDPSNPPSKKYNNNWQQWYENVGAEAATAWFNSLTDAQKNAFWTSWDKAKRPTDTSLLDDWYENGWKTNWFFKAWSPSEEVIRAAKNNNATVSDEKIRLINPRIEENPFYATAS